MRRRRGGGSACCLNNCFACCYDRVSPAAALPRLGKSKSLTPRLPRDPFAREATRGDKRSPRPSPPAVMPLRASAKGAPTPSTTKEEPPLALARSAFDCSPTPTLLRRVPRRSCSLAPEPASGPLNGIEFFKARARARASSPRRRGVWACTHMSAANTWPARRPRSELRGPLPRQPQRCVALRAPAERSRVRRQGRAPAPAP